MDQADEDQLSEIVRRIVAVSDPQRIILFGSQARGDAAPDSDFDLLVVKDEVESPRAESGRIYRALAGLSIPVDIVVTRSDYALVHRDVVGTVVRPALREGKVLYGK